MNAVRDVVKRHPLIAFFVLAYALSWWVYPLLSISIYIGFFGLFGPAVAAIIVTALTEGRGAVGALLRRIVMWQVSPLWYAVALGLPILVSLAVAVLDTQIGASQGFKFVELGPLSVVLMITVVGEELGWRGFALPRLLEQFSPLVASLLLGTVWCFWHLPTFLIAGTPQAAIPFPAYFIYVVSLAMLFTWLYLRTGGSVLLATLLHGAVDALGFQNVTGAQNWPLLAAVYALTAAVIVVLSGPAFLKSPGKMTAAAQE